MKVVLTAAIFLCASCGPGVDEDAGGVLQVSPDSAEAVAVARDEYIRHAGMQPHLEWFRRDGDEFVMRFNAGTESVGGGARIRVTAQGEAVVEELTQ